MRVCLVRVTFIPEVGYSFPVRSSSDQYFRLVKCMCSMEYTPYSKYKLGYVVRDSTAFKVQKDGCGVPSAERALLGPEGLLMQ